MRHLLAFLLLLCSSPCWATWTCAQGATGCTVTTVRDCSTSGASCAITVTSTHAHAVEALCMQSTSTAITLTSASDGGFTAAAGSHGTDATGGGTECAYNLNATGGATSITATFSGASGNQAMFMEFTGTGSSFTFDTSALIDDTVACTSCSGAVLALGTSNNYILIQASSCGGTCSTALSQGYTAAFFNGDGMGYKLNVSVAGTTPNWTMTSSTLAGGAIAIYEVVAAGVGVSRGGNAILGGNSRVQ